MTVLYLPLLAIKLSIPILISAQVPVPVQRPNIIFILADDLGWNDVGFHGTTEKLTPNIDALAYSGVILNSHYSETLCTPSRGALLTGKYPIHTGTQHNVIVEASPWGLPLEESLLPQHLNRLGYVSHAIGKWHLGFYRKEYTPTYRGFASHYGFWNSHQDYYTHTVQASFSPFEGMDMRWNMTIDWDSVGHYTTRLLTEKAIKLIAEHNKKNPLFLYFAHAASHAGNYEHPLQAPEDTVKMFSHLKDEKAQVYAAMIWELDQSVGKIVTALKNKGMLNNTIIAFVSDNGGATEGLHKNTGSNFPLKGEKATPWEGGIRTSALLWSPKLNKKHRVLNNLMHISDWLPTLYTSAGGNLEDLGNIDGINQWYYFVNDTAEPRNEILQNIDDIHGYSAMRFNEYKYVNGTTFFGFLDYWGGKEDSNNLQYNTSAILKSEVMQSLTNSLSEELIIKLRNAAKLSCHKSKQREICDSKKSPCLFNIKEDPCETNNILTNNKKIVREIERKLVAFRRTMIPPRNKRTESIANPRFYNNTWVNWDDYNNSTK
ncbi:arylsulfatase B-like [Rhodnius prolixus]|uniref:arylsulfatase B-like n=1 Tax=Rhodnius prolixus TaxID=13249 RepID=UPI003D18AB8A